jgi:hypothetical protein
VITVQERSEFIQNSLKFIDGLKLLQPSVNEQIGFDFQGFCRSYKEDPQHPASRLIAAHGRVWIYDVGLNIYANIKAGRLRQAGTQVGRVMQLANREKEKGYDGIWHFSYNTIGDIFIDPRGPTGANAWCLNAIFAYCLASGDKSSLEWANRMVREVLFNLQVVEPSDARFGLIRAGYYTEQDVEEGDAMGYHIYEGNPNAIYEGSILEHNADVACTYRLAYWAAKKFGLQSAFLDELVHRHDILMQGIRRVYWQQDHFISAVDGKGRPYTGTDGSPSIAVDNNTWSAHLFLPYDLELPQASIQHVLEKFLIRTPPAQVEETPGSQEIPRDLEGVYYFPSTFVDPFVSVPDEYRDKMENLIHPEATYGFILMLNDAARYTEDPELKSKYRHKAEQLYEGTVKLQKLYGPQGAPYATANVPSVFSTLQSITTATTSVIASKIMEGVGGEDFTGAAPPPEFTVDGKSPVPPKAALL